MAVAERELIDRAQKGDVGAFQNLVEMYKRKIYYLAYDLTGTHQDAEDLSQEVFVKAWISIAKFRKEAKLSSWLYRITVNTSLDMKRNKSRNMATLPLHNEEGAPIDIPDQGPDPFVNMENRDLQQKIERAMEQLTPRERTVFVMRHYQELMLSEIAETLKISEGTVKSLLFRALKRLQKSLAPDLLKPAQEESQ